MEYLRTSERSRDQVATKPLVSDFLVSRSNTLKVGLLCPFQLSSVHDFILFFYLGNTEALTQTGIDMSNGVASIMQTKKNVELDMKQQ